MKFKLSQITLLVVSALSVSAAVAENINVTRNKIDSGNGQEKTVFRGSVHTNVPLVYDGSIKDSSKKTTFAGSESGNVSSSVINDNNIHIGNAYSYSYFYSQANVSDMLVDNSDVDINGEAHNLRVTGDSIVTVTAKNAVSGEYFTGDNYQKQSSGLNHDTHNNLVNDSAFSLVLKTFDGVYENSAKQVLNGSLIGWTEKANQSKLTIRGKSFSSLDLDGITSEDLINTPLTLTSADEYLTSERDIFKGNAVQIVGEKSLSHKALFENKASQHLNSDNSDRLAIALESTFKGDSSQKRSTQNIGNNGLAIKSTFDDAAQLVTQNGQANNSTFTNNSDQTVFGKAYKNTLADSNQHVKEGGLTTDNTITNGKQKIEGIAKTNTITNGTQLVSGNSALADDNTLTNVQQKVTSGAKANRNTLTDSTQFVEDDALTTENILNGNSSMRVGMGGTAYDNTLNDNSYLTVNAGGKATGKTKLNGTSGATLFAATHNGAYVENLALNSAARRYTVDIMPGVQNNDAVNIGTLTGKGDMRFVHTAPAADYTLLNIDTLGNKLQPTDTTLDFTMNSNILNGNSDYINMDNAYGQHYVTIIERDTGKEAVLMRPQSADFAYVNNSAGDSNALFGMKDADGKILDLMDAGTYIHNIQTRQGDHNDTTWSFTATDRLTPSARAVLALSSAPQLMFNNEVDHMRARLQMLRTNDAIQNGLWMQGVGSNTKVDKDQIQYKLSHAGLELGADYQLALNSDSKLVLGGFTGFDKGNVKNDWAGTSDLDSYTFGAYATYMNTNGWYADGLLKYNHFDNKLHTTSTNGYDVSSDNYATSVWGMALETGYTFSFSNKAFITPYGQLAYNSMGSKNITLSNDMEAEIKNQRSFTSELGVNVGKDFAFNNGLQFSPYLKAAWNHQYENGNETEFNRFNTINMDLSGSTGKFGLGFNALYNNVNLYMEVQHIAGDSVYSPINGQVGIRYNF